MTLTTVLPPARISPRTNLPFLSLPSQMKVVSLIPFCPARAGGSAFSAVAITSPRGDLTRYSSAISPPDGALYKATETRARGGSSRPSVLGCGNRGAGYRDRGSQQAHNFYDPVLGLHDFHA